MKKIIVAYSLFFSVVQVFPIRNRHVGWAYRESQDWCECLTRNVPLCMTSIVAGGGARNALPACLVCTSTEWNIPIDLLHNYFSFIVSQVDIDEIYGRHNRLNAFGATSAGYTHEQAWECPAYSAMMLIVSFFTLRNVCWDICYLRESNAAFIADKEPLEQRDIARALKKYTENPGLRNAIISAHRKGITDCRIVEILLQQQDGTIDEMVEELNKESAVFVHAEMR